MQKVIISGYYLSNSEKVDYNSIEVVVPDCKPELLQSVLINRVVPVKFSDCAKPYTGRGKCFIDKVKKDTRTKPTYSGKALKELDWNEMQDLAIAFELNEVPLFRSTSIREARMKTYQEFCNKILGKDLKAGFDFMNADDLVLEEDKKSSEPNKDNLLGDL